MNEISFEEAFRRLETIVSTLESGRGELEESLAQYEEGIRLLRRCRQILDGAERRVEILKGVDENGAPILEQADENALRSQTDVAGRQTPPATAAKSGVRTAAKPETAAASGSGNLPESTAQEPAARSTRTTTAQEAAPRSTRTTTARRTTGATPVPASENSAQPEPAASPARTRTTTRRTSEPPKRPEPPRGRSFFDDAPPF
ncbi:MAG: exodeoxyribonuclease VII small subunit [Thermoguttaceae bacterium]|nr:exodeoxyribonuclease VII small subunit [Thermoguttaceae bacterium]